MLDEAEARILALEAKWNETLIFFETSDNETNTLLQEALDDMAEQDLELEILTEQVMKEVADMDAEIAERTTGLVDLVALLDQMVINFEESTNYLENFQQTYSGNVAKRFNNLFLLINS